MTIPIPSMSGSASRRLNNLFLGVSVMLACSEGLATTNPPIAPIAPVSGSGSTVVIQGARDAGDSADGSLDGWFAPFRSTTTVGQDDLDIWAPRRLEDLTGQLPGTVVEPLNAGLSTAVKVRGFAVTRLHFGGLPDIQRMFVRDPATVDRIEVVRGPSAALLGVTSPGGAINYVPKRATGEDLTTVALHAGANRYARTMVDHSGRSVGGLSYRLVGAVEDGARFHAALPLRRQTGMVMLERRYDSGAVGIDLHAQLNDSPFSFGTVITNGGAPGTPASPAAVAWDRLFVLDGGAPADRRYRDATVRWRHEFASGLEVRASVSAARVSRDEELIGYWTLTAPTTVSSYYTKYQDRYRQTAGRLEVRSRVHLASALHELAAGLDAYRQRFLFQGVQNIAALTTSVDSPDFSLLPVDRLALSRRYNDERIVEEGQWLSDRVALNSSTQVVAAVRRQRYSIDSDRTGAGRRTVARSDATTWFGGVEWQLAPTWRTWGSLASGMEPNRGATATGKFLPPQESRQVELGVENSSDAMRVSIALWNIELDNVAMTDPTDRTAVIAAGRRQVRGAEALATAKIREWTVAANATIQETRHIAKTSASLGSRFVGVPNVLGGLQLRGPVRWTGVRAEANVGLVAVGARMGDAANTVRVPGYVRVDGGMVFKFDTLRFSVGVRNAADKRYVEAVTAVDDVFQGARREWWFGIGFRL